MNVKIWFALHLFIIGCAAIEIGVFLKKLDENLSEKLSRPQSYNASDLFKDITAYSFNINRLGRLFKLKRDHIMEAAKMLRVEEHPMFIRNFSCEQVKTDFSLSDRQYKNLLHFMEKITTCLSSFYNACQENPGFVGAPIPQPEFSLERLSSDLERMFKTPDTTKTRKHNVLKAAEEFYYVLGKFTKKFILGRKAIMERAKSLFESGGLEFLKHYDYFKIQKAYRLTVSEAASLDSFIRKIQKRYEQFTNACLKNPNFENKVDFSSIRIIKICEQNIKDLLKTPSAALTTQLFKQIREFYHVLGFLRRHNIPHRNELLQALNDMFGTGSPIIIKPLDFKKLKADFQLEESMGTKLEEYIGHLRRRFNQVQKIYLSANVSGHE